MNYLINSIAGAVNGLQQPGVKVEIPATVAMAGAKRKMEETPIAAKRSKASKEHRLEQNRLAARASRQRKKKMLVRIESKLMCCVLWYCLT